MWIFNTTKGNDLIYINNTSKAKVLGATSDGKVILEDFEEGKAHQLWKKGELDPLDPQGEFVQKQPCKKATRVERIE